MHEKGKGAPAAKTRRMTEWNDGWDSQVVFFRLTTSGTALPTLLFHEGSCLTTFPVLRPF